MPQVRAPSQFCTSAITEAESKVRSSEKTEPENTALTETAKSNFFIICSVVKVNVKLCQDSCSSCKTTTPLEIIVLSCIYSYTYNYVRIYT